MTESTPEVVAELPTPKPAPVVQLAVRAAQQSRFPNMDLLRLHLKTAALQKVNLNVQGDNVRLSSQIASFRAQIKAIENETEMRVFAQCAAAGTSGIWES